MPDPQSNKPSSQGGVHFHGEAHINGPVIGGNVEAIYLPAYSIPSAQEIPAPPGDFVGRSAECSGLTQSLIQQAGRGGAVALIHGLGGVGKTALALQVAQLLRGAFPRRVRLDLAGAGTSAVTSEAALGSAIRALGYDPQLALPDTLAERQRLYLSLVATQPTLILADNAANTAQVRPLLPPLGSALLVTSRQRFTLPGANGPADVDLAVLALAEAESLLTTICARIGGEAAALARLCGCLPLALRISAGLLATTTQAVAAYLTRLADIRTTLQALADPDDPEANVAASFALSYDALDPAAQTTLAQLSVFPPAASFDAPAASAVVALPPDASPVPQHLDTLYRRSLLDWDGTARYHLHDLVRAFAADKLGDADAVSLRHAWHYAGVAYQAQKLYLTKDRTSDGLNLFDLERAQIDMGWTWARVHADLEATARVMLDYADATAYIGSLRYHQRSERIPQLEAGLAATRRLGHKAAEGAFLGNLGNTYSDLGEVRRTIGYYEQVLTIMREIGDRRGEGNALGNLGITYAALGEVRRAVGYYEQQLVITCEIGDRRGEGNALGSLGIAYYSLGEVRRAGGYYEQALTIMREIGDRRGEGNALGSLGNFYAALGEVQRAVGYYEQQLVIMREIGDRRGEGNALGSLGIAYKNLGDARQAISYYEQQLVITCEIGDRRGEGNALGSLGIAYYSLGEVRQAIGYYEQDLAIAREIGDRRGEAVASWNLGALLVEQGHLIEALALLQVLVNFEREIGHPDAQAHATAVAQLQTQVVSSDWRKRWNTK